MPRKIIRIGLYWYPPESLFNVLRHTWDGKFNQYKPCELIHRCCGDCPAWQPHMTLLDALAIVEQDRQAFVGAIRKSISKRSPIELQKPELVSWGNNVAIVWKNRDLENLRKDLFKVALDFVVTEQVSWEAVNELERAVTNQDGDAPERFKTGLNKIKRLIVKNGLSIIHSPNIALDWYSFSAGQKNSLKSNTLPFAIKPHLSVASAIRAEGAMTRPQVQNYLLDELLKVSEWRAAWKTIQSIRMKAAYIVEPEHFSNPPQEVIVIDKISGEPRREFRQRWEHREKIQMP